MLEDHDASEGMNGGETMGDDERRAPAHEFRIWSP